MAGENEGLVLSLVVTCSRQKSSLPLIFLRMALLDPITLKAGEEVKIRGTEKGSKKIFHETKVRMNKNKFYRYSLLKSL